MFVVWFAGCYVWLHFGTVCSVCVRGVVLLGVFFVVCLLLFCDWLWLLCYLLVNSCFCFWIVVVYCLLLRIVVYLVDFVSVWADLLVWVCWCCIV